MSNEDTVNQLAQMVADEPPQSDLGQQFVKHLTDEEQQATVALASQNYNLAQDFDEGLAREIAQEVKQGFETDDETRKEWLEDHTFWLSLYNQADYAENSDAERSWGATESLPVLMEACDQFQTRTYKTFFPNDTFVSAVPMNRQPDKEKQLEDRAERIGHHMSYQLGFKDRNYKQDKDSLFLGTAIHGSFFTKTYFSEKKMGAKIDNVRPTDLVVNYNVGPCRIEDLRRKTHIIYSTVGDSQTRVKNGYFVQPAMPALSEQNKSPYNVKVDETQGLTSPDAKLKRDKPAVYLEQQLYLDLDGDGNFRPYLATICAASRRLLRFTIDYEADQQGNPLKDFEQNQYYTHYKFKENPDGFYGYGLGHALGDLNSAINIMLRQGMDAATLANDGNMSGFISERLGLEGDEIRMVLGKFIKIPDTVGDLQNAMMPMKFAGPNESLIKIMEMLDERAQRIGATTEATTGTPDAVTQPTTYLAEIEQAMETFSAVQMRLANSFSDELQKIYKINQKYMPLVDYYVVNNAPEAITRQDYSDDMMIQPIFDPKFATQQQKLARASSIAQIVNNDPQTQQRPQVQDELAKLQLEALDIDSEDIQNLIPPPPVPQQIDNQLAENMQFMLPAQQRMPFDVFPQQDHATHLKQLHDFIQNDGVLLTDPEQQMAVKLHKQKHEAYLYGVQNGIIPPPQPQGAPPPIQPANGQPPQQGLMPQ